MSSYMVGDLDAPSKHTPALHYFRCNRVCKGVTVVAFFPGNYYRCGCGSQAVYQFSVPVETDEQKAIHAKGVVLNPYRLPPVPWSCVRCGDEKTGNMPIYRADGKVCKACYDVEMEPEIEASRVHYAEYMKRKAELEAAKDAERAAFLRRLAEEEQSINQSTE